MEIPFKLTKKITRLKNNSYYLGLIQNLYAGSEGEMVSFLQLFYQTNIVCPFNENFANSLCKMAMEELENAHKLSILLQTLNGDPIYATSQGKWLGARSVDYVKNFEKIIDLNIELKNKKIIDYKTTISKIDDIQINNVLKEILEKHIEHKIILQKIKISLK